MNKLVDCFDAFCHHLEGYQLAGERWLELRPGQLVVFRTVIKRRHATDRAHGWSFSVGVATLESNSDMIEYGVSIAEQLIRDVADGKIT